MKIVVRLEPSKNDADETVSTACVWTIGDNGETQQTRYLEVGQQVDITISEQPAVVAAEVGEVGPIGIPEDPGAASPVDGITDAEAEKPETD